LFIGRLPTLPENFMQIHLEVFAQSCQQTNRQTKIQRRLRILLGWGNHGVYRRRGPNATLQNHICGWINETICVFFSIHTTTSSSMLTAVFQVNLSQPVPAQLSFSMCCGREHLGTRCPSDDQTKSVKAPKEILHAHSDLRITYDSSIHFVVIAMTYFVDHCRKLSLTPYLLYAVSK